MLSSVFTRTLGEKLRSTIVFSIAATLVTAMYVGVYPSFESQMAGYAEAIPEAMRAFIGNDFASPAGYLQSTLFTILGPVLLVSAAVSWGAAAIAGEEEDHTLPFVLTAPLSRARIAVEKLAGVAALLTAVIAALFVALLVITRASGVEIGVANLFAASLHLHGLAWFAGAVAFGVGAATGRRPVALAAATGIVVLGFVVSGVSGLVEQIAPLRWASPFYWFNGSAPVRDGFHVASLGLLYSTAALAAAAGIWRFSRRDLR